METRAGYRVGEPSTDTEQPEAGASTLAQETPPQWFTQVANIYMQAACCEFGLAATRCFLYIVRHTDGFHQNGVALSIGEFCTGRRRKDGTTHDAGTKLSRPAVMAGLDELRQAHVITCETTGRGRGTVSLFRLCPPSTWTLDNGKESLPIENGEHPLPIQPENGKEFLPITAKNGKESLPPLNKERNKGREKENSLVPAARSASPDAATDASPISSTSLTPTTPPARAVKPVKTLPADGEAMRLAAYLRDHILAHSPNARDAKAARNMTKLQQWAYVFDLMLRRDERKPEAIRAVIDFATTDDFWQANILSPGKLRDKYDALDIKRQRRGERQHAGANSGGRGAGTSVSGAHGRTPAAQPDAKRDGKYAAFVE